MKALALTVSAMIATPAAAQRIEAPPVMQRVQTVEQTDAEFCATGREAVARSQVDLPLMIDAMTRLDGFSIMCGLRTVAWNKTVLADVSQMREGWRARKQRQWNEAICSNEEFNPAQRRGWRFVQNLVFRDGTRVILDAAC
jgi:hypothetical protein